MRTASRDSSAQRRPIMGVTNATREHIERFAVKVSIGSGELKLSGKELSASEPKRPILVGVRYESHNNVAW